MIKDPNHPVSAILRSKYTNKLISETSSWDILPTVHCCGNYVTRAAISSTEMHTGYQGMVSTLASSMII